MAVPAHGTELAPRWTGRDARRRGGGEAARLGRGSDGAGQPVAPVVGDPVLRDPRLCGDLPDAVPGSREQFDAPRLDAAKGVRGRGGAGGGAPRSALRGVPAAPRRRGGRGSEGAPDGRAPLRELLRGVPWRRRGRGAGVPEPARRGLAMGGLPGRDQDEHPRGPDRCDASLAGCPRRRRRGGRGDRLRALALRPSGRSGAGGGRQGPVRCALRRLPRCGRGRQPRPRRVEPHRRRVALRRLGGGRPGEHRGRTRRVACPPTATSSARPGCMSSRPGCTACRIASRGLGT